MMQPNTLQSLLLVSGLGTRIDCSISNLQFVFLIPLLKNIKTIELFALKRCNSQSEFINYP